MQRIEHGLFLFFDNFKLLLSTISTFGEAEIYNNLLFEDIDQAPVVQRVDNAIHRINHYPVDSVVCFANTYPLDSDLSGR